MRPRSTEMDKDNSLFKKTVGNKENIIRAAITFVVLIVILVVFYILKSKSEFYISTTDKLCIVGMIVLTTLLMLFRFKLPKAVSVIGELAALFGVPAFLFFRLEPVVNDLEIYKKEASIFNYIIILAVILVVYGVFAQNAGIAIGVGGCAVYIFYLIDYFVINLRGTPVLFSDFLSWRTAIAVSSGYHYDINRNIVIIFYELAVFIGLASFFTDGKKKIVERICVGIPTVAAGVIIFAVLINSDILTSKELTTSAFVPVTGAKENGLFVNNILTTKASIITEPKGYSVAKVNEIIEKYSTDSNQQVPGSVTPNVIVVMNESFTDLDYLENVQTTDPTIPQFKALSENCVKGTVISSILGGNTPNSEFECLTGCSMAFLPNGMVTYQQMIDSDLPTMASWLSKYGYDCTAIHLYNPEYFDRTRIYPLLGFDEFININNVTTDVELFRDYATDESTFNAIKDKFEHKSSDERLFCFAVTIQNHGGYWWQTADIKVKNAHSDYANEYASLLRITDDSFAELLEYFSSIEEPTIICMYGDHQPYLDIYDDIWEGYNYTDSEKRYMQAKTPFVIWANYDIEEQNLGEISINYLGPTILEVAGVPMSDYYKYLNNLKETLPVICAIGFKDKEGNYFADYENSEYKEIIEEYSYLQYNYLKGLTGRRFYGE